MFKSYLGLGTAIEFGQTEIPHLRRCIMRDILALALCPLCPLRAQDKTRLVRLRPVDADGQISTSRRVDIDLTEDAVNPCAGGDSGQAVAAGQVEWMASRPMTALAAKHLSGPAIRPRFCRSCGSELGGGEDVPCPACDMSGLCETCHMNHWDSCSCRDSGSGAGAAEGVLRVHLRGHNRISGVRSGPHCTRGGGEDPNSSANDDGPVLATVVTQNQPHGSVVRGAAAESPREYSGHVLNKNLTDLFVVKQRLESTIEIYKKYGDKLHFKQRHVKYRCWNHRSLDELRQLAAIAGLLMGAGGGLVAQTDLLTLAEGVARTPTRATTTHGVFGRWLLHNLAPSVCRQRLDGLSTTIGVFFYKFPVTGAEQQRSCLSYRKEAASAAQVYASETIKARLSAIDPASYVRLLPTQAQKRVVRSLLGHVVKSGSFLRGQGISVASQTKARVKVTCALIAMRHFEQMGLEVSSDETTATAALKRKRGGESAIQSALADAHGGGRESLLSICAGLGVNLGATIEGEVATLSSHHYTEAEGGGAGSQSDEADGGGCAGSRRDSALIFRKVTLDR